VEWTKIATAVGYLFAEAYLRKIQHEAQPCGHGRAASGVRVAVAPEEVGAVGAEEFAGATQK
jgi:hypothetical protein